MLALARQYGALAESLPERYAALQAARMRPLRQAEGTNQRAAARLAVRLASGRDRSDEAVRWLVAAQPT